MSDDFATGVLTNARKGILRQRTDREGQIERLREHIAELEVKVADDNDRLRQLDEAIQARAALTPAPDAPGSGHGEIEGVEIPEGFTRHDGGPCPVAEGEEFAVLQRDGSIVNHDRYCTPYMNYNWQHIDNPTDIIAYRVLPSEPAGEGETETYSASTATSTDTKTVSVAEGYQHVVDAEPAPAHHLEAIFTTRDDDDARIEPFSVASSAPHAAESDAVKGDLPPLFPPEPPKAATVEELADAGIINGDAYWLSRKIAKEMA